MAASVSADVLTNGLAFLWIAVVFRRRCDDRPLTSRDAVGLWLLLSALGLCKTVYWALAALALTIPAARFGDRRRHVRVLLAIFAGSLIPTLAWTLVAAGLGGPNPVFADPEAQLARLRSDPLFLPWVLVESVRVDGLSWLQQFVGVLGWLDTELPRVVYAAYPALLGAVALSEAPTPGGIRRWERALLVSIPVGWWLAVMSTAFVNWTAPGEEVVRSFQGRYLIPVAPLLVLAMQRSAARGLPVWARRGAVAVCGGSLLTAVGAVVMRYHVAP